MRRAAGRFARLSRLAPILLAALFPVSASGSSPGNDPGSGSASIDGVTLHYIEAGKGPAVILLHGYAETSRMWRPIIPKLAERFTVIAPDLPGIGDSGIPENGLDMKTAATRIHGLVRFLGIAEAEVVGHDIGLTVAYAYAAQYPGEVRKLVLMDRETTEALNKFL